MQICVLLDNLQFAFKFRFVSLTGIVVVFTAVAGKIGKQNSVGSYVYKSIIDIQVRYLNGNLFQASNTR